MYSAFEMYSVNYTESVEAITLWMQKYDLGKNRENFCAIYGEFAWFFQTFFFYTSITIDRIRVLPRAVVFNVYQHDVWITRLCKNCAIHHGKTMNIFEIEKIYCWIKMGQRNCARNFACDLKRKKNIFDIYFSHQQLFVLFMML